MQRILLICLFVFLFVTGKSQGFFSGEFQSNFNIFVRDTTIGTPGAHYDNLKSGTDNWLTLNYNNAKIGLDASVRFDFFYNSILHNPSAPFTGAGLGRFNIAKTMKNFKVTAGYIYEQFGSGIVFRSYEERALGIDNAVLGAKAEYNFGNKLRVKAFAGVQKNRFTIYNPILKGLNAEGDFSIKDKVTLTPGFAFFNRTLDQASMDLIVKTVQSYEPTKRFVPTYNSFLFSGYNTIRYKGFSWYVEGAYKTKDNIKNEFDTLVNRAGNCVYTSASYSQKGWGLTAQFKRTENFTSRTSPNETLLKGMLNFIPPTARQNSLRLPARYFAPSLELRELAFGFEATYSPHKKANIIFNYSEIRDFLLVKTSNPHKLYFREAYIQAIVKPTTKIEVDFGFQYVLYNKSQYRQEPPFNVNSYTPFVELTYKINRKKSIRTEIQYQHVVQDYGQWIFALLEFNIAPKWSFAISDMWNIKPNLEEYPNFKSKLSRHYYSAYVGFTQGANRFALSYVRQVQGIVCTGGVCRLEPAFSGVKFTINSTF